MVSRGWTRATLEYLGVGVDINVINCIHVYRRKSFSNSENPACTYRQQQWGLQALCGCVWPTDRACCMRRSFLHVPTGHAEQSDADQCWNTLYTCTRFARSTQPVALCGNLHQGTTRTFVANLSLELTNPARHALPVVRARVPARHKQSVAAVLPCSSSPLCAGQASQASAEKLASGADAAGLAREVGVFYYYSLAEDVQSIDQLQNMTMRKAVKTIIKCNMSNSFFKIHYLLFTQC